MDKLQHDPRTKKLIKETLYHFLYGHTLKSFKARIDLLIMKNALMVGSAHQSFIYKGTLYSCDVAPLPRKANRLVPQLHAAMDDYLKDIKELNTKEIPYVIGFINQVLNSTNELHDYLRVLPDSVHEPITTLINTCPCRTKSLTEAESKQLQDNNSEAIALLKRRLLLNLIQ